MTEKEPYIAEKEESKVHVIEMTLEQINRLPKAKRNNIICQLEVLGGVAWSKDRKTMVICIDDEKEKAIEDIEFI
jgi:hypothetical protein